MPAPLFHNQYDKYSVHKKCSNYEKRVRNFKLPDPAGYSILFTAVSDNVLTNLQQLSALSGTTSCSRPCQNTPRYEHWELLL